MRLMLVALAALTTACAKKEPETASAANDAPAEAAAETEAQTAFAAPVDAMTEDAAVESKCPVLESRNWAAWIDKMPAPDADGPRLRITGEIDVPTPGYTVEWREGPADRAMPPGQRMILSLTAPGGMVAQVVTTMTVDYAGKAAFDAYRAIYVVCEGEGIAEITDIGVVE